MARHRKPHTVPAVTVWARRQLAACLVGASALTATLVSRTITPTAPVSPDRTPAGYNVPEQPSGSVTLVGTASKPLGTAPAQAGTAASPGGATSAPAGTASIPVGMAR
ncbi:hypothetical protein [Streptomyces sp. NPDC048611]|uniref:hypothetical protein n=1 Tax=Streptomyces sp. NPDC048611 TaxID=3155635 RepID=UPI00341A4840